MKLHKWHCATENTNNATATEAPVWGVAKQSGGPAECSLFHIKTSGDFVAFEFT